MTKPAARAIREPRRACRARERQRLDPPHGARRHRRSTCSREREIEGGPANLYLRRLGNADLVDATSRAAQSARRSSSTPPGSRAPASGSASASASRWCSPRKRLRGSGTSGSRTPTRRRVDRGPGLRAGPCAGPLRRGAHERVLREPVRRLHAARPRRSAAACSPRARTWRWAAAIRGRRSARWPRRQLRDRRAPAPWPRDAAPAQAPPGLVAPRAPRHAGSTSTRWPCSRTRSLTLAPGRHRRIGGFFGWFEADHPAASRRPPTSRPSIATLALPRSRRRPARVARRRADARRRTLFTARPLLALPRPDGGRARRRFWGDERRHVERDGRPPAVVLRRRAAPRRACAPRSSRVLRPHGHLLRTGARSSPTRRRSRPPCGWAACSIRLLTQGHVSINRFLSTARQLPRPVPRAGAARLRRARRRLAAARRARRRSRCRPSGCRWLYAHAGGLIEVRVTGADRPARARPPDRRRSRARRCASLSANTSRSTATTARTRCRSRFERDGAGVVVRAVARHRPRPPLPRGCFRIEPADGTTHRAGRRRRAAVRRRALAPAAVRD